MINESPMVELSWSRAWASRRPTPWWCRPKACAPSWATRVRAEFEAEMATMLKRVNDNVADYEQLRMIVVAREPWSIENGCLTPTMKIKRARIEAVVNDKVDQWYAPRARWSGPDLPEPGFRMKSGSSPRRCCVRCYESDSGWVNAF
jgi:long-chain acyl-CoA synthetase